MSIASNSKGSTYSDAPQSADVIRDHTGELEEEDDLDKSSVSSLDSDLMKDSADADESAFYLSDRDDDPLTLREMYEELEDIMGPGNEEELWKIRMFKSFNLNCINVGKGNSILTKEDRDNIRAFKLKMMSNMPRHTFDQMQHTF